MLNPHEMQFNAICRDLRRKAKKEEADCRFFGGDLTEARRNIAALETAIHWMREYDAGKDAQVLRDIRAGKPQFPTAYRRESQWMGRIAELMLEQAR